MANSEEDFSFPTALEPFSLCGIDSPPLWRLSPAASPIYHRQQTEKDRNYMERTEDSGNVGDIDRFELNYSVRFTALRRRFSSGAEKEKADEDDDGSGEEETEKMDMLWENFNEELSRSRKSRLMKSAELMEENKKMKAMTEYSSAVAPARKTGKTAIVKVLKRLFLLHNNSRRKLQTRSW